MCPDDKHSFFGEPDLFTPVYDEVHISCTFTWDIEKAYRLAESWKNKSKDKVKVGGVAINGESTEHFKSGIYLKKGITITSRGCPNNCSFCMVKNKLIEFDVFPQGNIIQDNNFLACSERHKSLVYKMLKNQKAIEFKGGLESKRMTAKVANNLRGLRIKSLWLACDHDFSIKPLKKATEILKKAGFNRNHLYCYALIGKEELRLKEIFNIGCMPFAQLYQAPNKTKTEYTPFARSFQRAWCRPALYKSMMTVHKQ